MNTSTSCTELLAKCFHEAFHFAICFWPQRSNSAVLETKIIRKLGKLVTIKRRTVIKRNNLRHTISGKDNLVKTYTSANLSEVMKRKDGRNIL